jgi:molybdopterin-guanine dinucleotide biosynthesis protein A
MVNKTTIIPCAGLFFYSNSGFVNYSSNAMLPLNGKPAISWIIDNLKEKNIQNIIVVSRKNDIELNDFLSWAYSDVKLVQIDENISNTILHSIYAGLQNLLILEIPVNL